jgi:hypothetical protein
MSEHETELKIITEAEKFRLEKSKIKAMLITFFNKQGAIHKEFVPEGQRVNSVFSVEVIGRLLMRISRVRLQFRAKGFWFLLQDNVTSYSAMLVKTFLAKHDAVEINHQPYTPDPTSADFSLLR